MKSILKVPFALTVLSVALLGCTNSGIKVKQPDPNPLPKIEATQSITKVFELNTSSTPDADPLRYQLDKADGIYYVVDPDGQIFANDGKDTLWKMRPAKSLTAGVSVGQGLVVVGNRKGQLFVLDAKTGETLWQQQLSGSILSPALIYQNRVITISNDGVVYANDVQTGQLIWTFSLPDVPLSVRGYAAPTILDERTIVVASANAYVYAVDVITGAPRWQRRVAVNDGRSDIQRLIDVDGQPVISGSNMITVSYQGQVTAVDLNTQKLLWSKEASSLNSPAADNQSVYVANTDGRLVAYDLYNGRKIWENDQLGYRHLSNPVLLGNTLVVGDYEGVLHIIDPATGTITGRANTSGDVRTLSVKDNLLYVATTRGDFSVWQLP